MMQQLSFDHFLQIAVADAAVEDRSFVFEVYFEPPRTHVPATF